MGAGLIGHQVRAHAAINQFRQDIRRIRAQGDGHGFPLAGVARNAGQRVIQRGGLLIHVASTQTKIDTALLAFNRQRTRSGQRRG